MAATGLPLPGSTAPAAPAASPSAQVINIGGFLPVMNAAALLQQRQKEISAVVEQQQSQPVVTGLVGHIRKFWSKAEEAKRTYVEKDMLEAMYARRGEYTTEKLQQIQENGQPAIYMMLAAAKMRQVEALLRDVVIGTGAEKPWTARPTPIPELPLSLVQQIKMGLQMEIQQAIMMGVDVTIEDARQRLREVREQLDARLLEEAKVRCERMEQKMEDQLVEGGYLEALDSFITDLATFKTAFIAGPIVRNKPQLAWTGTGELQVENKLVLEWERVDPFDMYPAPWARHINEGPLIRRHRLTREELFQLIGVEGYSEEAIRKVIDEYGAGGLHNWLSIDTERATAEGKDHITASNSTGLIDALQYWGSASGKMLREWGLPPEQVEDEAKDYQIEAWLIGNYVIKAVLNADPLARRPYYCASFQKVPGSVWGFCPYDLMRDCQDMCNAAARALAANMGISSGPQVYMLSDRLPPGEDVKSMFPWKIWQFESDQMGSSAKPIEFFQPSSNANELMQVYEKFSLLADEYTGIPRYMAGFNEGSGGAGRTASGMSMMIGNASKVIKQVVGSIDVGVFTPMLERLYYYNMRYSEDEELKGDVKFVARGALSLATKEAAQVRTMEMLQFTNNPVDLQIIGLDGRAELLRNAARRLDMNTDKIVPPAPVLKQRAMMAMMQQAAMAQQNPEDPEDDTGEAEDSPPQQSSGGKPAGKKKPGSGQKLMDGSPTTDNFQPA